MPTKLPRALLEVRYYQAAQEYLRELPLEHFAEAVSHARQREITLESFDLVSARRPDFQVFNELLVQYSLHRQKSPGQVVPDNMVVLYHEPIKAVGSYDVPLQPVKPFWVLEYVSKSNRRKDYDDNIRKYEYELKVPYYLLFVPDEEELTLYRHKGQRYASVKPNTAGRCAIKEIEIELALLDGWVRYWYRGELLPLPGELQSALDRTKHELAEMTKHAEALARKVAELESRHKNGQKNGNN